MKAPQRLQAPTKTAGQLNRVNCSLGHFAGFALDKPNPVLRMAVPRVGRWCLGLVHDLADEVVEKAQPFVVPSPPPPEPSSSGVDEGSGGCGCVAEAPQRKQCTRPLRS